MHEIYVYKHYGHKVEVTQLYDKPVFPVIKCHLTAYHNGNRSVKRLTMNASDNNNSLSVANISSWVLYQKPLTVWFSITNVVSVIGTIFYALLVKVLIQNGEYKRGSGILMLHLLFVDICMVAVNIPIKILGIFIGLLVSFTPADCTGIHFTFLVNMNICNYAQLILAINRFIGTLFPHLYRACVRKPALVGTIATAWAICIANNLPRLFGVEGQFGVEKRWKNCQYQRTTIGPYIQAHTLIGVYIPTLATVAIYLVILVRIGCFRGRIFDVQDQQSAALLRSWRRRARMAKILFAVSLWYCCCYYPESVLGMLRLPAYQSSVTGWQLWVRTIFLCGYALTPVIFFGLNTDYRIGLVKLLGTCLQACSSVNRVDLSTSASFSHSDQLTSQRKTAVTS